MLGILDLFKVKGIQTPNAVVIQASGCTFSVYAFWPPTQSLNQGYHTPHQLPVLLGTVLRGPLVLEAVPLWGVLAGGRGLPDSTEGSQLCILHTWRMYWSRDSFSDVHPPFCGWTSGPLDYWNQGLLPGQWRHQLHIFSAGCQLPLCFQLLRTSFLSCPLCHVFERILVTLYLECLHGYSWRASRL